MKDKTYTDLADALEMLSALRPNVDLGGSLEPASPPAPEIQMITKAWKCALAEAGRAADAYVHQRSGSEGA
jgi:hypothetical protein